jgi:Zn-finger nucleic acid-binding protein
LKFKTASVRVNHPSVFPNEIDRKYEFYITRIFDTLVTVVSKLKEMTEMKCPVCKTPDLLMSEREGIEIDYCGTCRGIWLDRGELDKLLARIEENAVAQSQKQVPRERFEHTQYGERERRADWGTRDDDYKSHRDQRHQPYKKKKSLLNELFDFG